MSLRRLIALLIACAALGAAGLAAVAQPPTEPPAAGAPAETRPAPTVPAVPSKLAYATTLPDSAGRAIVERWCLMCHSAMLITQQAKDSTAWEKTLAQMEKWGVVTTPEERDSLRAYLVQSFGPRPSPAPKPAKAPAPRDSSQAATPPR
jgi:cytochrome c5